VKEFFKNNPVTKGLVDAGNRITNLIGKQKGLTKEQ
jgi:hypothetical protein